MSESILAIGGLGTPEILVIAVVIFLLFGATRLPQLAKALGQSKKAFKEGLDEGEQESGQHVEHPVRARGVIQHRCLIDDVDIGRFRRRRNPRFLHFRVERVVKLVVGPLFF